MLAIRTVSINSLTVASSSLLLLLYILSGARSALPMGVAPEAIAEKFFLGIGSKGINSRTFFDIFLLLSSAMCRI
jgi:hypothetical protein